MKKNTLLIVLAILILVVDSARCQNPANCVTDVILSGYSAKLFTIKPVTDSEIDLIVKCGMKAPSSRNSQGWKFTVIKNEALNKELLPDIIPGNILIVISGLITTKEGYNSDYDCGLATQNMYIAAQGLGLGAHIYFGPVGTINSSKKQVLGIPDDYRAIMVLRIGNMEKGVDAVSGASARKKLEDVVIYK